MKAGGGGEFRVHRADRAELALAHAAREFDHVRVKAPVQADGERDLGAGYRSHGGARAGERQREGFFDVDMLARCRSLRDLRLVQ